MKRTVFLAAFLFAATLPAGGADEDLVTSTTRQPRVANYLGVSPGDKESLTENTLRGDTDFNGDGVKDWLVMVRKDKSVAICAFLGGGDGSQEAATPAGVMRLDATELPAVTVADLNGDGTVDFRFDYTAVEKPTSKIRRVALAALTDGKLDETYRGLLEVTERSGLNHRKSEYVHDFIDGDGDGIRELIVTSRHVDLMERTGAVVEVPGSEVTSACAFGLSNGQFEICSSNFRLPSAEQRLEAAQALLDTGSADRAVLMANAPAASGAAAVPAATGADSPDTVALPSRDVSPDTPAAPVEVAASSANGTTAS